MDPQDAFRYWVSYFLTKRKTSLIINGKITDLRREDFGIPQGSPTFSLLFLTYTSSL